MEALAKSVAQNGPSDWWLTSAARMPAEDAEQHRVDVEQARDEHQRQEARDDEVLDGIDAEHLQRVELLADLARAEVGGDRGAGDAREHDRGHEGPDFAHRREHEEPAEAVECAEDREEVRRLQSRRAVVDGKPSRPAAVASTGASRTGTARRTPPIGVGRAQRAEIVLPVSSIMSPTSSSAFASGPSRTRAAAPRRRTA